MEVSLPRIECTTSSDTYARFEIGPLEQGYGVTLGNALRRVLISSLPGAAVTAVQIEDIRHEFSDIEGVKEDVTEFILNLKKVRLRAFSDEPIHLTLEAQGEGQITAGDIQVSDLVEIVNPDQHLLTLDTATARFSADIMVERGVGYYDISEQREDLPIGQIPVDGVFAPVDRVNFRVEPRRVGNMTNFDELILEIWTDGTIHPNDALTTAAAILTEHFQHLAAFGGEPATFVGKPTATQRALPSHEAETPIDELQLSARAENSLKRAGLTKVGQVVTMNPEELMSVRNFGQKSFHELVERLKLRKLVPENFGDELIDHDGGEAQ